MLTPTPTVTVGVLSCQGAGLSVNNESVSNIGNKAEYNSEGHEDKPTGGALWEKAQQMQRELRWNWGLRLKLYRKPDRP